MSERRIGPPSGFRSPQMFRPQFPPPPPGWGSPIPPHLTNSPPPFLIRPIMLGRGRSGSPMTPPFTPSPPFGMRGGSGSPQLQTTYFHSISSSTSHERSRSERVVQTPQNSQNPPHLIPQYDMEIVYPGGGGGEYFYEKSEQSWSESRDEDGGLSTADIIAAQSQNYVDEKLAEYQATIHHLQDEQERVQKKTFTNWINSYLAKHIPPLHTVDLIEDLKDGTRLLALLSVLSGHKLPVERGRNLRRPHFLSNCNTALQFLQSKRIKLVNINSSDIVDGKPAVVLGLVWTIILYFQIEESTKVLASLSFRRPSSSEKEESGERGSSPRPVSTSPSGNKGGRLTPSEKWKEGARKALLQWVQGLITKQYGIEVTDFGSCWRDGTAFLALINSIKPGSVDMSSLRNSTNKSRLETGFRVAEELGIPRLLDPEDVDVGRPDEKSVMTYVAQFLHKANSFQTDSFSSVQSAFEELLSWLHQKTQFMEHMKQTGGLSSDFRDFSTLQTEMNNKKETYVRLKTLVESMSLVGITEEAWNELESLWLKLGSQLREWQWRLDSNLPDPFGRIGQWLANAEMLINTKDVPEVIDDEAARVLNAKIEEHKAFFVNLPSVMSEFSSALSSPIISRLPQEQIQSMASRLALIEPRSAKRLIQLKYLEHKCCLVAFILLVESKLKLWTVKYGRDVQVYLDQYNNFVNKNKIFSEFDRAYADMKVVVEEYKREGGIGSREGRVADHFLWEVGQRWSSISMELRCVASMLEEVRAHWRRYDSLLPQITTWIQESLPHVNLPEEEKIEYFQDLSVWEEKFEEICQTVSFLVATCDPEVTAPVESSLSSLKSAWTSLFQLVKQYQCSGATMRLRNDFLSSLAQLQKWTQGASEVLNENSPVEASGVYEGKLRELGREIDEMDESWRRVNKKFQGLLPQLAGEEVERLMKVIKKEKENLVRIRSQIPVKLAGLQSLVAQHESIKSGVGEIGEWIGEGETLLTSYAPKGMKNSQDLLEMHRRHFAKTVYYKTMLESKKKLMSGISHGDQDGMGQEINFITDRFAQLEQTAQQWETKLNECIRCWRNYEENKLSVVEWLRTAEKLLNEKDLRSPNTLDIHRAYFTQVNEKPIKDLVQSSQSLKNCADGEELKNVLKTVENLQSKWSKIIAKAPIHLAQLEFRLEEDNFIHLLKEMDKEIHNEQLLLNKQADPQVILSQNKEFFGGDVPTRAKSHLESLLTIERRYSSAHPQDSSLNEGVSQAQAAYKSVLGRVESMRKLLEEIPEQWTLYKSKFAEVSSWMDSVDFALGGIMTEVNSAQDFETEKAKFLDICRDVDLKREDMKMLVKQLDLLASLRADEEALNEQNSLEKLIQRYKSLVPTIEVTMIKTETQSKCYSYREETQQICVELSSIEKYSSEADGYPDSLEEVEEMIRTQSGILSQIEGQRSNIVSLIQKGKDLTKDPNAPQFVQSQIDELDSAWREVHNDANERLKKLKDTRSVWEAFTVQRTSILNLLSEAESELENFLPQNLDSKQKIVPNLKSATSETLVKLKNLSVSLSSVSKPERKKVLEAEVEEIEKRLSLILSLLDSKIQNYSEEHLKISEISGKIEKLRADVDFCKKLLMQLLEYEMPPEERVGKTEELLEGIGEKLKLVAELEVSLGENFEGVEVRELSDQINELKEGLNNLSKDVGVQATESKEILSTWTQCKSELEIINPWLENAQLKIEFGLPQPSSLQEAQKMRSEMRNFGEECKAQQGVLMEAGVRAKSIANVTTAPDEIDTAKNKLGLILSTVSHWKDKSDALVKNWEKFEVDFKTVDEWVSGEIKNFQTAPFNYSKATLPQLRAQQAQINDLSQKLNAEQSNISSLSKLCDSISSQLSPQAAPILNTNLKGLKAKISQLNEKLQAEMNIIAKAKEAREGYETKVSELETWMSQFSTKISCPDIFFDAIETSILNLRSLSEEHSSHQPQFDKIYEDVKLLTSVSPSPEVPQLSTQFSSLSQKYQDLETQVSTLKTLVSQWGQVAQWHNDMGASLEHIVKKLELPQGEGEKNEIEAQILRELEKCGEEEDIGRSIDKKTAELGICVKDRLSHKPISAQTIVHTCAEKLKGVQSKLNEQKAEECQIKKLWTQVHNVQESLATNLLASQEALLKLKPEKLTLPSLNKLILTLEQLKISQEKEGGALKAQIHDLGKNLMSKDPNNLEVVQSIVLSCDSNYDKVSNDINEKISAVTKTADLWRRYEEAKNIFNASVQEAQNICGESLKGVATDSPSALSLMELLKKYYENIESKKPLLSTCSQANYALCSSLNSLPNLNSSEISKINDEIAPLTASYSQLSGQIIKKLENTETELGLWKNIEEGKDELISWLSSTYETLQDAENNFSSPAQVKKIVSNYKNELPYKLIMKSELESKLKQLAKMNSGTYIPSLDSISELVEEGFDQVAKLSDVLLEQTSDFENKESSVRNNVKNLTDKANRIKNILHVAQERTMNQPLVSILDKLKDLKQAKIEGEKLVPEIQVIEKELVELNEKFPEICEEPKAEIAILSQNLASTLEQIKPCSDSLINVLEKSYFEIFNPASSQLVKIKESIKKCSPANLSPENIEEIEREICECSEMQSSLNAELPKIAENLKILNQLENYPQMSQINLNYSNLVNDLKTAGNDLILHKSQIEDYSKKFKDFKSVYDTLDKNLEELELGLKNSPQIVEISEIEPKILFYANLSNLPELKAQIAKISNLGAELGKISPLTNSTEIHDLEKRQKAILSSADTLKAQFQTLKNNLDKFDAVLLKSENLVKNSEKDLNELKKSSSQRPNEDLVAKVKFHLNSKEVPSYLNEVLELSENIVPYLVPQEKENLRAKVRALRDNWENFTDGGNGVLKNIEALQLKWTSFSESQSQVNIWLNELVGKTKNLEKLQPSLGDKKNILSSAKTYHLDASSHMDIISVLGDKVQELHDAEAVKNFTNFSSDYEKIKNTLHDLVQKYKEYIANHENYNKKIEGLSSFINNNKTKLNSSSLTKNPAEKFNLIKELLEYEKEGKEKVQDCENELDKILKETHESGHAGLKGELNVLKGEWEKFLDEVTKNNIELENEIKKKGELAAKVDELSKYLKEKEIQVKDQSLKSTVKAKEEKLGQIQELQKELNSKIPIISQIVDKCKEVSESEPGVAQLKNRHSHLLSTLKDLEVKYIDYVKEHNKYNSSIADIAKWLNDENEKLNKIESSQGDIGVLKERSSQLALLNDSHAKKCPLVEEICESGEKLYAHTSPDGREIIRQEIRSLRDNFKSLGENIQKSSSEVSSQLSMVSDFTSSQSKLSEFLKEVEVTMLKSTALKSNLPDKKSTLSLHTSCYAQINNQADLVKALCQKASSLASMTKDESLVSYVTNIQQLYNGIKSKSGEVLGKLTENVELHARFNEKCKEMSDWLKLSNGKIGDMSEGKGDKGEIGRKLKEIEGLSFDKGAEMLKKIKNSLDLVKATTSDNGKISLDEEVKKLDQNYTDLLNSFQKTKESLTQSLSDFTSFENELSAQTQWLRSQESLFKSQTLYSNSIEKEKSLSELTEGRNRIKNHEIELNKFIDGAHELSRKLNVDKISPLLAQLTNKYQILLVLSKEQVNRAQTIYENHKGFDTEIEKTEKFLGDLEKSYEKLGKSDKGTSFESEIIKLGSEVEECERKINNLVQMSEKLYVETSASGREGIRSQIDELREKLGGMSRNIEDLQKKQAIDSHSLKIYEDTLSQTLDWLSSVEKYLANESLEFISIPDSRSRLVKLKTHLEDAIAQRKMIDGVSEKAQILINRDLDRDNVGETTRSLNERYEKMMDKLVNMTTTQEEILDLMQEWIGLTQKLNEFHKGMWEQVAQCSDYSGGKLVLEGRVSRVKELHEKLNEGEIVIENLNFLLSKLPQGLSSRTQNSLTNELENLKFAQNKLRSEVEEMVHSLEDRVKNWSDFESGVNEMSSWLNEAENTLKSYAPADTLLEKQQDLNKFKDFGKIVDSRNRDVQSVIFLAHKLEEVLEQSLKEKELDFEKLRTDANEVINLGESSIQSNVKQISSRFQTVQNICKEILKKCEESVKEHKNFVDEVENINQILNDLETKIEASKAPTPSQSELETILAQIKQLNGTKPTNAQRFNALSELGEKLYGSTGTNGIEAIRSSLNELLEKFQKIYDALGGIERTMQEKLTRLSGFEETKKVLSSKVKEFQLSLPEPLPLMSTLDEKRCELVKYRTLLNELHSLHKDISELGDKSAAFGDEASTSELIKTYESLVGRCEERVKKYESIVANHEKYMSKVQESGEFSTGLLHSVALLSDESQERLTIQSNLSRLQNLLQTLPEDEFRVEEIRSLGNKVLPDTAEQGQYNIQQQIDASQQEWESLLSTIRSNIESLQHKIHQFTEFESGKEKCLAFIKDAEIKLHAELKPTLETKSAQLSAFQELSGEIKGREIEVDAIAEKSLSLQSDSMLSRSASVSTLDITAKYQHISNKVKELISKWQTYVSQHQTLDDQLTECQELVRDIKDKLEYCSDITTDTHSDLEAKLNSVQELLLNKEEGYAKIHKLLELTQTVLASTSPNGHRAINEVVEEVQTQFSFLSASMVSTKNMLEETIHRWAGFLEQIQQLDKVIGSCSSELKNLTLTPLSSVQDQTKRLEEIKKLNERLEMEKEEASVLSSKIESMSPSEKQSHALSVLSAYTDLRSEVKKLLDEGEAHLKFHKSYKEAYLELSAWIQRLRERVPKDLMSGGGKGVFDIETASATYSALLNKKPQGIVLLDRLQSVGELLVSNLPQDNIRAEIRALGESLETLFKEIEEQQQSLSSTMSKLNEWKDEMEVLSDWTQQNDILIKNTKTTLPGSLEEKRQKVKDTREVYNRLESGKAKIEEFTKSNLTQTLLKSALHNYVAGELQRLNSRFQVQLNTSSDLLKKVENTLECHEEFVKAVTKAKAWIENAREILRDSAETSSSSRKERIQEYLDKIEDLLRNEEADKNLVHTALSWGEKSLRNTRSDGKDTINAEMNELQTEWDRVMKKIGTAKTSLNQKLLEWADYNTSYTLAKEWISDREAKLEQVVKEGGSSKPGMSSKKATLRATNTIVQDIVSLEPLIETLASKAGVLMQETPPSEIYTQYEQLMHSAQEIYAKQKEAVELQQAFNDLVTDFMSWMRGSKERLGKICEPQGDISVKTAQITVLQSELKDGEKKLELLLSKGNEACNVMQGDDKELIEQQVAVCADEFDSYSEELGQKKHQLEVGLVRSKAFDEEILNAEEWIRTKCEEVKEFHKLSDSLEEKKTSLEKFQLLLQTVFDWQKELDNLHMKAQELVDSFADSRVTTTVTEISTKFNALLALCKEIIRRLEQQYQEHQQYEALSEECSAWIESHLSKLSKLSSSLPTSLPLLTSLLSSLKQFKENLEQGSNKLRYVQELRTKVLLSVSGAGAGKIQEESRVLKEGFEKVQAEYERVKVELSSQGVFLEEIQKMYESIVTWLKETETKMESITSTGKYQDLSEKRGSLEKLRGLFKEISAQSPLVSKFTDKLKSIDLESSSPYFSAISSFDNNKTKIETLINDLQELELIHEKYWENYTSTSSELNNLRIELQKHCDWRGSKTEIGRRLEELSKCKTNLIQIKNKVEETKRLGEKSMESCTEEGKEIIGTEMRLLKNETDGILSNITQSEKEGMRALELWGEYETQLEKVRKILADSEEKIGQIESCKEEGEKSTPEDLDQCKKTHEELNSHQAQIEDLRDKTEQLFDISGLGELRDSVLELQNGYSAIMTRVQALLSKYQKSLADHTEFIKAKENLEVWLSRGEGSLLDASGVGDESNLNERLKTVNLVAMRLTEGDHLLVVAQEAFGRVLNLVSLEVQEGMKGDLRDLRNRMSKLNLDVKSTSSGLKESLQKWENFAESIQRINSWISEKEEALNEKKDAESDIGDVKYLYEFYKTQDEEFQKEKLSLDALETEADLLSNWSNSSKPINEVNALKNKWTQIHRLLASLSAQSEAELKSQQEFKSSLQEAEKWILSTSFQLMAHNSLTITNREQTADQLLAHDALLSEMDSFDSVLHKLRVKGQEQGQTYQKHPNYGESISKQIENISSSYSALLATASQIRARLAESLAQFEAYEETLESIMRNLDEWERDIINLVSEPIKSVEDTGIKSESIRVFHNKLQGEKTRLNIAVQSASNAAASLSRPSSPQDSFLQPIPDRELAVRSRLEDNIDQSVDDVSKIIALEMLESENCKSLLNRIDHSSLKIQSYMAELGLASSELESIKKAKDDLNKWVTDTLTLLNDILKQPAKLRAEAVEQEINTLNALRSGVGERLMTLQEVEMQESSLLENKYLPNLFSQLSELDDKILETLNTRQSSQESVDNYLKLYKNFKEFLDSVSSQLDSLEKGSKILLDDKLLKLNSLQTSFESQKSKLDQIKECSFETFTKLSVSDSDYQTEQLKSLENRSNSLHKRILNRIEILKSTQTAYCLLLSDIEASNEKIAKNEQNDCFKSLGFEVEDSESILNSLKNKIKDLDSVHLVEVAFSKRLDGLRGDLEEIEITEAENKISKLGTDHSKIVDELKKSVRKIGDGIGMRKQFRETLENVRNKLANFSAELVEDSTIPLSTLATERKLNDLKKIGKMIVEDLDSTFSELFRQANVLEKESDEDQARKLKDLIKGPKNEIVELNDKAQSQIKWLESGLKERKDFETKYEEIKNWGKEAENSFITDSRSTTSHSTQLSKFEKVYDDADKFVKELNNMKNNTELTDTLNSSDSEIYNDQIENLCTKISRISVEATERINKLKSDDEAIEKINKMAQEHLEFLTKTKGEVSELGRDKKLANLQNILQSYESLQSSVSNNRLQLDSPEVQSFRYVDSLQNVFKNYDELNKEIENSVSKLRQLILLYQQYLALIMEISSFTTRCRGSIDLLKSSLTDSLSDKIRKCDDLVPILHSAESSLSVASDKGLCLGDEVGVEERNEIVQELQTIKNNLSSLKNELSGLRTEYESMDAEQRKYMEEIEQLLNSIQENEGEIRQRPELEIDSMDSEFASHEVLSAKTSNILLSLENIESSLKDESNLSPSLSTKLSEIRLLLHSIPPELLSRLKYLEENRELREEFRANYNSLDQWAENAQKYLKNQEMLANYLNLEQNANEYKENYGSEKDKVIFGKIKDLRVTVDKIMPSLSSIYKTNLLEMFKNIDERIGKCIKDLKRRGEIFDDLLNQWSNYEEKLSLLTKSITKVENIQNVEGIGSSLHEIKSILDQSQTDFKTLNGLELQLGELKSTGELILKDSDKNTEKKIREDLKQMGDRIAKAKTKLEESVKYCNDLIINWEEFEEKYQNFETSFQSAQEKFSQIDFSLKSQQHLNEIKTSVENLLKETVSTQNNLTLNLVPSSEKISAHLKRASKAQHAALTSKMEKITKDYGTLVSLLQEKLDWITSQDEDLSTIESEFELISSKILDLSSSLSQHLPLYSDSNALTQKITEWEKCVKDLNKDIKDLNSKITQKFTTLKQSIPVSFIKKTSGLEIELEKIESKIRELKSELKSGLKLQTQFTADLESLTKWVKESDEKLSLRSAEPQELKMTLKSLSAQVPSIMEQLESVKRTGKLLAENTGNSEERASIITSIDSIDKEVKNTKLMIEERKLKINDLLDAWQRFLQLYAVVLNTIEEKKRFLEEPLSVSSLAESRLRHNDYSMNVKTLSKLRSQLNQMGELHGKCAEVSTAGPLSEKLSYVEQLKMEVESEMIAKCSLLHELSEEWERCESKLREISDWLEKTRLSLDAPAGKRKPLRDQLSTKEKILADIQVQKTKIGLNLEKLQVHFKSGIGGDKNIEKEVLKVQDELDAFHGEVKSIVSELEASVNEIDKLQEEVQMLRNQLFSAEQQLRHISSSASQSGERDNLSSQQTALKERLKSLQSSITSKNQRIITLMHCASTSSRAPLK